MADGAEAALRAELVAALGANAAKLRDGSFTDISKGRGDSIVSLLPDPPEGVEVSSPIEQHLYGSRGTHALLSINLGERQVVIVIAPWSHPAEVTEVVFEAAEVRHVWAAPDTPAEEATLPWDIIAFDSTELACNRWEFVIHCGIVEFCWRSAWPGQTRRSIWPEGHIG